MRFGGDRVLTPNDEGAYLLTFSLFPGKAQPSGYLNFSQTRDQYMPYSSSVAYINGVMPSSSLTSLSVPLCRVLIWTSEIRSILDCGFRVNFPVLVASSSAEFAATLYVITNKSGVGDFGPQ
ncbi:hypothetical protein ON010_g11885 [Phytophthora cinnamomi]|nr:hypothetical protein ON010_g11885 [Phytophthora cinnamomi]